MTPEYRKKHLAHCRAYDKAYDATHKDARARERASRYHNNRAARIAKQKLYNSKHKAARRIHGSWSAAADAMIADALS